MMVECVWDGGVCVGDEGGVCRDGGGECRGWGMVEVCLGDSEGV